MPRSRAIAAPLTLAVLALTTAERPAAGTPDQLPPGPPPPFAFRTATLDRQAHAIDVELSAVAHTTVRVTVGRRGVRLGRAIGELDGGTTFVRVPIGPKGLKPLRRGLHIDLAIEYGSPLPLRLHPALRLAPHGVDDLGPT